MDVRRLAAIDMYGSRGTRLRRRIILAEFVIGACAMVGIGVSLLTVASDLAGRMIGAWFIGAGLNYVPLAAYAVLLSRPDALEAELRGVETGPELRRYTVRQLWILIPLLFVVLAARAELRRSSRA